MRASKESVSGSDENVDTASTRPLLYANRGETQGHARVSASAPQPCSFMKWSLDLLV